MKDKKKYGDFVQLTDDEYTKLVEKFGEQSAREKIETLNEYKGSRGRRYKSDYYTILCWNRKDTRDAGQQKRKLRLYPIIGKVCGVRNCRLPAVYKDPKGAYDSYYCNQHMPEKVKEYYE